MTATETPATSDHAAPAEHRSWRGASPVQAFALLTPLVLIGTGAWSHRWTSDDGFINLRIVAQIVEGHGPVYNQGERVEAGTSFLWTALLASAKLLLPMVDLGWLAVVLGIIGTVAGLAFAMATSARLVRPVARRNFLLPVGAVIVAALPPMWDFATSGLETGFGFAWIGLCTWGLARRLDDGNPDRSPCHPVWLLVAIGLGPFVRPDFGLFSACFLVALVLTSRRRVGSVLAALGIAAAAPVALELWRMAYYAALVPNTALAKEAGTSAWARGMTYLGDFVGTYAFLVPLVLLAWLATTLIIIPLQRAGERDRLVVFAAPIAAALLSALYIVAIGGDFMHARLLLPAVFALLLPVAIVPVRRSPSPRDAIVLAMVGLYAVVLFTSLRVDYGGRTSNQSTGITDERAHWAWVSGHDNPVTIDDYAGTPYGTIGQDLAAQAANGEDVLVIADQPERQPDRARPAGSGVAAVRPSIGIIGYAAGTDVWIVDRLGLTDPIAGRLELEQRRRAGHDKSLSDDWIVARFARDTDPGNEHQEDARSALGCGQLADLLDATSQPLTISRAWQNLLAAPGLTRLRIPGDPTAAAASFCT